VTIPTHGPNLQDDRWDGYVPWFLRHPDFAILGQFDVFFDRVAHRVEQFFLYGEGGSVNLGHVGAFIESESHQCFRFDTNQALAKQIQSYFSPAQMAKDEDISIEKDLQVIQKQMALSASKRTQNEDLSRLLKGKNDPAVKHAQEELEVIRSAQRQNHRSALVLARLTVLESVLRHAQTAPMFRHLRTDLRRYLAEAQIMLDIREKPAMIVPMEETIFQKEVIDRLLPRLASRFPQQEKDLVKAYHDLVQGVDTDAIFILAVKALEEIARKVSGKSKLTLDDLKIIKAAFPDLHPTIHTTILKLAHHRGDKAGHGRQGPPLHEMRYLLFSICNVALLFLDYPSPTNPARAS
jgi:hypothetical protein